MHSWQVDVGDSMMAVDISLLISSRLCLSIECTLARVFIMYGGAFGVFNTATK
jgi:hypothetical protein